MISTRASAKVLLVGLGALSIFQMFMFLGVLPDEIVWGGQAGGPGTNLVILGIVALFVTILFAGVVAAKAEFLGSRWTGKAVSVAMWVVFGYFALSVLANMVSLSSIARAILVPVSVILALFSLRLAMSK